MICLKNRTFAVSQTSKRQGVRVCRTLWFAWKIVLLQYHKHQKRGCSYFETVVICLKNRTFAVSQTSRRVSQRSVKRCDLLEKSYFCSITNITHQNTMFLSMLWFAWKIVLLQYHKHLRQNIGHSRIRCDLLEKSYFCSITNIVY